MPYRIAILERYESHLSTKEGVKKESFIFHLLHKSFLLFPSSSSRNSSSCILVVAELNWYYCCSYSSSSMDVRSVRSKIVNCIRSKVPVLSFLMEFVLGKDVAGLRKISSQ